jgi:hypothetical protein
LELEWRYWLQKFDLFLTASGGTEKPEATQLAMFLASVGDEGLKLFNSFDFDDEAGRKKLKAVQEKFKEYCTPRKNIVFERFNFWKLVQAPGETIDSFVTSLRLKAKMCEFGEQEESLTRDHVVINCPDIRLQERLLREPDLTLQKMLQICRAAESTKEQMKLLRPDSSSTFARGTTAAVYRVERNHASHDQHSHTIQPGTSCYRCGKNHARDRNACPAIGKQCTKCGKYDHFSTVCHSTSGQNNNRSQKGSFRRRHPSRSRSRNRQGGFTAQAHELQLDNGGPLVDVIYIDSSETNESSWWKTFSINDTMLKCKLDSGAEANVMSLSVFNTLTSPGHIRHTASILTAYNNGCIKPSGIATLSLQHKGQCFATDFYVVDYAATTIIGLPTCRQIDVLRRVDAVSPIGSTDNTHDLISQFADIFSGLGCFPGEYHIEIDPRVTPVIHPPRRVPLAIQPKLKATLDAMEKAGTIVKRSEPTDWVNSLLIVEKRNGSLRLCLDPKDLNSAVKREHFAVPSADDIISRLHGKRIFTVIDMRDGFWHIKLDDESSKLCTFNTMYGRYSLRRLPFGISSAPEVFVKNVTAIFGDIEGIYALFDDLIIAASTEQEHDDILRQVFLRAREKHVRFNREKLQHKVTKVKYAGVIVADQGSSPDPDKVKAIVDMEKPADAKALHRFIGMVTYMSKFIPQFSQITEPLRALLKKDVDWSWSTVHDTAFSTLKKLISNAPVFRYFDIRAPAIIQTDASSGGCGSCLLQHGQPVAYASRAFTDTECRYAQIEKELLSIVFACEKFSHYIYGCRTQVYNDHKPLQAIFNKPIGSTTPRLQRMLLRLLKYNITVQYLPGKDMHIADTLSRAYLVGLPSEVERSIEEDIQVSIHGLIDDVAISYSQPNKVREATAVDPELTELRRMLLNGFPSDSSQLSVELKTYKKIASDLYEADGIICHNAKIVIPCSLRPEMLEHIHEGHMGMEKCKALARQSLYWPNMSRDIENIVAKCHICNSYRNAQPREPLIPHEVPARPWQKLAADIFTVHGKDYLLVADYFSKYPEVCYLVDITAASVILRLKSIFARHGIPEELIADNMPFNSLALTKLANQWNFVVTTSSPRYAQSNGQAERMVQTVKKMLKKAADSGNDWFTALLQYRNTPIADSSSSPAQLLLS